MTRAMLLSAGLSTRLGGLGDRVPKPILPVCDIPILRYGIANLAGHGIRELVINLHHRGEAIEAALGDGSALGVDIQYVTEPAILGTGGGLKNALSLLDPDDRDEPFLSLNGKLIFDLDVTALLAAYRDDPEALGMLVVRRVPDAADWGAIRVARDGGRLRIRDVFAGGDHMFCGVHVTRPSTMRRLPDGEACSIRQGYLPWMRAGEPVAAFEVSPEVYFCEHSTPERYLEGNLALVGGATLRHPPGPTRGIDPSAHIDSTAIIRHPVKIGATAHIGADAVIGPAAVIGAHAIVEAGARVSEAVVWTGARVSGEAHRVICTSEGRVGAG